jgi:hypothetical protein
MMRIKRELSSKTGVRPLDFSITIIGRTPLVLSSLYFVLGRGSIDHVTNKSGFLVGSLKLPTPTIYIGELLIIIIESYDYSLLSDHTYNTKTLEEVIQNSKFNVSNLTCEYLDVYSTSDMSPG